MSQSPPIACSLSSRDLESRLAELGALGGDGLESVIEEPGRAELRFRPDPGVRRRVEAAAAAEADCCGFLEFRVQSGADATVLTICSPNGGAEAVEQLVAAFRGGDSR